MGYAVDQKPQMHSELGLLMPRLKAFAAALTGSEAMSLTLLKAARSHFLSRAAKDRGHTPLALWAFTQMHTLWASRMKPPRGERGPQADPRLFCPRSRVSDPDAVRFARLIAQLGPQQRGTVHLVYGERLSYDEVAEVFGVPVSTVMTRLSRCHALLGQLEEREAAGGMTESGPQEGSRETGASRQGRAA